jgi:hypothetical protein
MLASDVVSLASTPDGLVELCRMYQLSRRQGEAFYVQAKRIVNQGSNPVMVPGADVATVRNFHRPPDEPIPDPPSLEAQAQARARAILGQPRGQVEHDIGAMRARIALLERNVEKGFPEWEGEIALLRATLQLLEVVPA